MASELGKSVPNQPLGLQAEAKDVKHLHARDLYIAWGDDSRYWQWIWIKDDDRYGVIEAAKLLHVWWLEAKGTYDMSQLKIGSTYRVVFEVIMQEPSSGWEYGPVTLTLALPGGQVKSTKKYLNTIPLNLLADLEVGFFIVPPDAGNMIISLTEIERLYEKKGLTIRGIRIEQV